MTRYYLICNKTGITQNEIMQTFGEIVEIITPKFDIKKQDITCYRTRDSIMFHFMSEMNCQHIDSKLREPLNSIYNVYFLTVVDDSSVLSFRDKEEYELFINITNPTIFDYYDDEDDEDYEYNTICKNNFTDSVFNMDAILDKINEQGISSLTNEEKKFLEQI